MPIDHAGACGQRVHAQTGKDQVHEGDAREDDRSHPGVSPQELDAALGHHGRARNGIDDTLLAGGRLGQYVDDAGVDLLHAGGGLVEVVETPGAWHRCGRRVPGGPQPPDRRRLDGGQHLGGHQARPARPEAHHRDLRRGDH